jgi:AGZA family xanthine/uracil permease-like MFS transporter
LFAPLQQLRFAYGPALMAVGLLMTGAVAKINFEDLTEAVPALATITMMLFTFNIANGLTAGLALYPVFKLLTGRWRDLNLGSIILSGMCLCYLIFGLTH